MNKMYLIGFLILGFVAYLHSFGIIDPFNELIRAPNWIFITVGIMLGMLLQRALIGGKE